MGFYQQVANSFGGNTAALMKRWSSLNIKLANSINRRNFLLRCRRTGIQPKHIQVSTNKMRLMIQTTNWKIANEMERHIKNLNKKNLNLEIKVCYHNINKIKIAINDIHNKLGFLLPLNVLNEYSRRLDQSYSRRFNKVKNLNIGKFRALSEQAVSDGRLFVDNSKWFRNISNIEIPKDIQDFLSLGPKFGISPTYEQLNIKNFLADVETIIDEVPEVNKNMLRAKITNNITNFQNHFEAIKLTPIQQIFKKANKFINDNNDLYILQADKGGCTVAMNKNDYMLKVETLLSDISTYVLKNRDPNVKLQRTLNELIKQLKLKKEIDEGVAKHLTTYNSVSAKLYCLPKIHKTNVPLRPIVSCVGCATYNLSKFLSNILTESLANITDYNIRDTFSFVNFVQGVILPENYVLVSLDVISLFTNIPVDLVIELICLEWEKIKAHTSLARENFVKLIQFVCDNCYFSFGGKFYQQIFGTPMGSPISPILAQIVMDYVVKNILQQLPFEPPFLYKFVDDIITAIPKDQIHDTLQAFNSFNEHVQFTIETETNSAVPFLDTMLIRTKENHIILDWYQKPTSSGRYINYFSNHPMNQKYNTVIAMKNRVVHISDESFIKKNLNRLFDLFLNNGYPRNLLKKLIYNSGFFDGPTEDGLPSEIKYKKLPFVRGLTDGVISHFKMLKHVKIARYNTQTIRKIFTKTKDKTPLLQNCNVVYKIPCGQCGGCYVGQTAQNLKQRITQHKSDCRIGKKSCALCVHFTDFDHRFDYEHIRILEHETNIKKRLFLEMVHINNEQNCVNSKADIDQLSTIYCNVINSS